MVPEMVGDISVKISFIPIVNLKRTQALLESNLLAIRFTDWNGQKALVIESLLHYTIPRVLWLRKLRTRSVLKI
jgi:hypothetical protein